MTEKALQINIPSDVCIAMNKSEEELIIEMRMFTAMPRWEFEYLIADHQIPISNLQSEDIINDLEKMKAI